VARQRRQSGDTPGRVPPRHQPKRGDGEPVERIVGVRPEAELRSSIDPYAE